MPILLFLLSLLTWAGKAALGWWEKGKITTPWILLDVIFGKETKAVSKNAKILNFEKLEHG